MSRPPQDAALDALQEQLDAQILGTRTSLLGLLGHGFVVPCCRDVQLLLVRSVSLKLGLCTGACYSCSSCCLSAQNVVKGMPFMAFTSHVCCRPTLPFARPPSWP